MAQKLTQTQWDTPTTNPSLASNTRPAATRRASSAPLRIFQYSAIRMLVLFVTVAIAVYVTILVANMGGFVDEIKKTNIEMALMGVSQSGALRDMTVEEKFQYIEQARAAMIQAEGLNDPFILRCFRWLGDGLTMNWGDSRMEVMLGGIPTHDTRAIILDALPRTLLIFGLANFLLFFTSMFVALALVKYHGRWVDRLIIVLSPMSSAPAWIYGILLNLVFLRLLGISLSGTFDAWPTEFRFTYIPLILKHMLLPFLAIFLSGLFQSIYAWRAFFHLYSSEDYVEMAKAKGLSARTIERRYILRTALPAVLTSFALMMVTLWQEVIALEIFFNVKGIGQLFYTALMRFDMPIILGLVVTFAYLLAITIFVLDILYALVDPRVRIGNSEGAIQPTFRKSKAGVARFWPIRKRRAGRTRGPKPGSPTRSFSARVHATFVAAALLVRGSLNNLKNTLAEIANHPSAVLGLSLIAAMICTSAATVIAIPYDEAIALWRGDQNVWYRTPANAAPEWVNYFRKDKLPETIVLDSRGQNGIPGNPADRVALRGTHGTATKSTAVVSESMTDITLLYTFDYPYEGFPQDLVIRFNARYQEKKPLLALTWLTPDGREIDLGSFTVVPTQAFYASQDSHLKRLLKTEFPQKGLFADPSSEQPIALPGTYQLKVQAAVFEQDADLDGELTVYGQVYGLAGTDSQRRDLMIPLLWGMPVALAFGLLAAVGTTISSIVIAATGVWFGGWVDGLVQRITEVNMILPFIPVSIMIFTLYSKSFWVILGVTVLLSIFGNAIKNYRAIFLQVKEAPYIEAARAYGAGNCRIVFRYLIPRISAILVPQLVILIPGYVFLEATLSFLQVSDPLLPTWGKLIVNALSWGAFAGNYHLILEPAGLLFLTGFAFAIVGFSLERIFEPRLRER